MFKVSTVCCYARSKTRAPLHYRRVDHTLVQLCPRFQNALTQLNNVLDVGSVDYFFHDTPNCVVYRIEVRAVRWPESWWDKGRSFTCEKLNCLPSSVSRSTVLLKHVDVRELADVWQKYY